MVLSHNIIWEQKPYVALPTMNNSSALADRPNVILITMDTVRADHLSLYGYERDTTPNLMQLAEDAVIYTHAIASADHTLPSHASIFTSMYASNHGAYYASPDYLYTGRPLDAKFHTLAELLSQKGYSTMGIVANSGFLGYGYGLDQGFQYHDSRWGVPFIWKPPEYYLNHGVRKVLKYFFSPSEYDKYYRPAEDINQEVFDILSKVREKNERFFIFINYFDAHLPYYPPPPFDKRYPGKVNDRWDSARNTDLVINVLKHEKKVTEDEHNHMTSQYDGEIAYVDFHIGKLIVQLKELGLYANSLIIITSDHGEAFGEKGLIEHGISVYQNQVHIPLIIKFPNKDQYVKISSKKTVHELVSVVDIMPTIMDVLNYEIPGFIDGKSLLNLDYQKDRNVFSESYPNGGIMRLHNKFHRVERAIFSGYLKLINSTAGKQELYDLSKDPFERKNHYDLDNTRFMELEISLKNWIESKKSVERRDKESKKTKIGKETLNRLKTLGYIK